MKPMPSTYANYSVFKRPSPTTPAGSATAQPTDLGAAVEELDAALNNTGVTVRGLYDASGFRFDSDLILWLIGEDPAAIQAALRRIRTTALFAELDLTWQVMGVHRAAEFNERHAPAFLSEAAPKQWLTIYPFVRSYDWYLLPEAERSEMLREHGMKGAAFKSVLANTIASFAISDYEWMLAFEADELTDLVDMMRDLRYTEARRHVREETPFYAGRRISTAEVPAVLRYGASA